MKRAALGLLIAWIAFLGVRWGLHAWTPAEERIRSALDSACEAFSEGETGDVLQLFATGFQAQPSGVDRDELWEALRYLQFLRLGRGEWVYGARLDPETLQIDLDPNGSSAQVAVTLELEEFTPAERTELWRLHIEGLMVETDGRWQWMVAEHHDLAGHRFR